MRNAWPIKKTKQSKENNLYRHFCKVHWLDPQKSEVGPIKEAIISINAIVTGNYQSENVFSFRAFYLIKIPE